NAGEVDALRRGVDHGRVGVGTLLVRRVGGEPERPRGRRPERIEELGIVATLRPVGSGDAPLESDALELLALLPRNDLEAGEDPPLQRRVVDQRPFEIGRAEVAARGGKLEERAKAGERLDVLDALGDEAVELETGGAPAHPGLAG